MIRSEARLDVKRKRLDHKKRQFATATYKENEYSHRLSFYDVPPTANITLEEFEVWAIDRLRSMKDFLRNWHLTDNDSSR